MRGEGGYDNGAGFRLGVAAPLKRESTIPLDPA
ncbi:hypothetical protein PKCBPO_01402 [Methylorubrum thiocyanatum]